MNVGTMLEQDKDRSGPAKCSGEMESGPAVTRNGAGERGVGAQMSFEPGEVTGCGGFVNIQGVKAGKQEVAHQSLAAVNGPKQSRDALRITAFGDGGFMFDKLSDFRGSAPPDQRNEMLTHARECTS